MPRPLNRPLGRRLCRHSTRMLGGAHRPRPVDELALVCRLLAEVVKIDQRLIPYMAAQRRLLDEYDYYQEWEAAIRRVYGDPDPNIVVPSFFEKHAPPVDQKQLLKDELALAKTRVLFEQIKSKLRIR